MITSELTLPGRNKTPLGQGYVCLRQQILHLTHAGTQRQLCPLASEQGAPGALMGLWGDGAGAVRVLG